MFTVAIIGRPNVGKSTLFNRLVGKRLALVDDTPGVTRDRRSGDGKIGDISFNVIDTAGLEVANVDSLEGRMRAQTEAAILEADICLFLIDARIGVTPTDEHFADLLRISGKPIIPVANKAEGKKGEAGYYEAYSLGFGEPVPISAEHGEGMADLYQAIRIISEGDDADSEGIAVEEAAAPELAEIFDPDAPAEEKPRGPLQLAVVGRPNVGKSTFINYLIGEDRLLTGPEAGITRDTISVDWMWQDNPIRLFDTAGMRRKAKVQEKLEKLSVSDSLRAIQFAQIVVVMLDATMPFEKQDLQIAALIAREGRGCVIALNKWDLIEDPDEALKELRLEATRLLPQMRGVPVVPISGLAGSGIDQLMKAVFEVYKTWNARISTARLNRWLDGILNHHPPPAVSGRRIKLRYMTQAKTRPPTFFVSCSRPDALPSAYERYLINALRDDFGLMGVPLRLMMRKGENPYASRAKRKS
uniref:ribosome biogenesis GTPase Der n=1 Tax=Pararhizobium sp. IMCC3301 TaxID=3067904 RepID=UPI00274174F9|nr:ribosome biogenesis GTPase Der [Pararhizobium sp. IMCC3301]